jgi:hypothetical protein
MVFALDMEDSSSTCWRFTDSLILPSCEAFSDCGETLCFRFPQGWNPVGGAYAYTDTVVCFSVCELDTVNLLGYSALNYFGGLYSVSSDSADTFKIINETDSIVIMSDTEKPIIHKLPIETRNNLIIAKGDTLRFTNTENKGNMNIYTTGDTVFFRAKSDTTVVAIGSGTWYISGTAQWTSSCNVSGQYSMAVGENLNVTGNYITAFGSSNDSVSGDYSLVAGSNHSNISGYNCVVFGNNNDAVSGAYSAVWGEGNKLISGEYSTTFGRNNRIYGNGSSVWGLSNKCYADETTIAGGYNLVALSSASFSFLTGLNDTLFADSTFRSAFVHMSLRAMCENQ